MIQSIDASQIELDTARCTWHLLNGSQRVRRNTMLNKYKKKVRTLLKRKQERLGSFINLTLVRSGYGGDSGGDIMGEGSKEGERNNVHQELRYYQGYHDISCIFLSSLGGDTSTTATTTTTTTTRSRYGYGNSHGHGHGNHSIKAGISAQQQEAIHQAQSMGMDLPTQILSTLSHSHLHDMMKDNFTLLIKSLRLIVFPLMNSIDPQMHDFLKGPESDIQMEPFFCLSWVITWFSHDIRDTDTVKRLFDLFVCSHPLMPIYMAVAMVVHPVNRLEVMEGSSSGGEYGIADFASVHKALTQLPMNSCSVGWKYVVSGSGSGCNGSTSGHGSGCASGSGSGEYVSWEYEEGEEEDDNDNMSFDGSVSVMSQDVYREESSHVNVKGMRMNMNMNMNVSGMKIGTGTNGHGVNGNGNSHGMVGDDDSLAPSLASESMLSGFDAGASSRVPFQEVIDLAVTIMRRIPPRNLMRQAHRYYDAETMQELAGDASAINFLNAPPAWAIASTIKSDLLRPSKRRSRGTQKAQNQKSNANVNANAVHLPKVAAKSMKQKALAQEFKYPHAVIAAGIGPDGDGEVRMRRKRRKMMRTGAIVIGVLSILIGVVDRGMFSVPYSSTFSSSSKSQSPVFDLVRRSEEVSVDSSEHNSIEEAEEDVNVEDDVAESVESSIDSESFVSSDLDEDDNGGSEGVEKEELTDAEDMKVENEREHEEPPIPIVNVPTLEPASAPEPLYTATVIPKPSSLPLGSGLSKIDQTIEDDGENPTKPHSTTSGESSRKKRAITPTTFTSQNRSPAAQKISAFVRQSVKPIYQEAKLLAHNMKPKEVGQKICREAMVIAKNTRDIVIDDSKRKEMGKKLQQEAMVLAKNTKLALVTDEAEVVLL